MVAAAETRHPTPHPVNRLRCLWASAINPVLSLTIDIAHIVLLQTLTAATGHLLFMLATVNLSVQRQSVCHQP